MVSVLLSVAIFASTVASASIPRSTDEGPVVLRGRLETSGLVAGVGNPRAALDGTGESIDLWESPLVWVAGAVLANLALAVGILLAFRRRRAPDDAEPPS